MKLNLLALPKLIAERRSSAILGLVIIVMLWAGVLLKFSQDVSSDLKDAARTNQSFAMVFEENVLRSIDELDNMLFYLRGNIEARKATTDYNTILHATTMPSDILVQVSIIDAQGIMRASTAGPQPAPPMDLSDREHFKAQVNSREDRLFISKPLIGRVSKKWSVQLSRRFLNADGSFGGVVVASLDPEHFTTFYDKVDLASSGSIALIGTDGVVRSAGGQSSDLRMGQDISGSDLFNRMQTRLNGEFEIRDRLTGQTRLVALRKVKGQPLWVSVSLDKSEVLAGSYADFRLDCVAALFLTLVILAAMELIFRTEAGVRHKSKELEQALEAMARLASEDSLTGLLNRRGFRSALTELQEECRNEPQEGIEYALLFLDLDRFKVINDTLGHRIGDLLLQETARRLRASLRSTDVMARLGGDEFAVIARYVKTKAALDDLAHCLIKAIREPFELGGYRVRTTISIGIAVSPADGEGADDLIVAADLALYAAKERHRDGYQFYDSAMSKELTDRRQIEVDLRDAIEHNELELRYQPIVSLHDGKVTGFEALARWNHRTKGFIPPSDFIPVAEDTGMMARLGEWALSEACGKLAQLPDHLSLAVNLSPVQFTAPDLVESVQRALVASGLAPHRLELEITERLLLENNEEIISVLRRLRQLGVRIALDDFGTGYSALSYLRKFPLDKIKIDRSFVTDIATRSDQVAIIQAVLSIARALGMTVTAEGVETAIQKDFLTALGCDSAQGYLFGKPVPFDEIAEIVAQQAAKSVMAA
ncbi:MAG: EAL domain-containing protein [Xanthobacteraceae bacterium]